MTDSRKGDHSVVTTSTLTPRRQADLHDVPDGEARNFLMSEQLPDPGMVGAPQNPIQPLIPGPVFKRVCLIMMAVILIVLAVIIGYQILG
jgi:hypothetical protein